MPTLSPHKKLLLIGASRGLGFALAEAYLERGWHVVATERSRTTSKLHDLLGSTEDRLEIETVDINYPDQRAPGASERRREHTKPREYDGRAGWKSGSSVSGLPGPESSVVSTNIRIAAASRSLESLTTEWRD